jgi:hypothetical protein
MPNSTAYVLAVFILGITVNSVTSHIVAGHKFAVEKEVEATLAREKTKQDAQCAQ